MKLKILKTYIAELILFFLAFLFLFFARSRLQVFISQINFMLSTVRGQQITASNPSIYPVISNLGNITNNALIFAYLIIPIALILLFSITQSYIWSVIRNIKLNKNFFFHLFLPTLIISYLFLIIFFPLISLENMDNFLWIFILSFLTTSILFIYYATFNNDFHKDLKNTFRIFFKKLIYILALTTPLFILYGIAKIFSWITLLSFFVDTSSISSNSTNIFFILLSLLIIAFYRNFYYNKIKNY